jgi:proteasome lid subunit RPN8/RPN11
MGKRKPDQGQPRVTIEGEVLRQIRQHARSNSKTEVCGVLIGEENGLGLKITARIAGLNAAQAGTYVTFTQDTWEHIYKIKDKEYPEARIVGWYHSHPGFGVFLSDHDTFIHKNFFSAPLQVAWVYDPHSDEEGCFGWSGERLERLEEIRVKDDKGGEEAGETGKPEPVGGIEDHEEIVEAKETGAPEIGPPRWLSWVLTIASHLLLAAIAFIGAWFFFPREVILVIDPISGIVRQGHISRDGSTIEVPGLPPIEIRRSGGSGAANRTPQQTHPTPAEITPPANDRTTNEPGGGKSSTDQKDPNAPRK